jgi:hypothetical protein
MADPTVVGMMVTERIAAIARTLERELREVNGEAAGAVRFAGAVVTQLTAAAYAIELCKELGTGDVAQIYAPFEPYISFA